MKDRVKGIVIIVVLMSMWIMCCYVECHYTRKDCKVIETQGQMVTVEDKIGYTWCYEAEGDVPSVGAMVDVYMYTAHTDSYIYDDEIIRVVVQ